MNETLKMLMKEFTVENEKDLITAKETVEQKHFTVNSKAPKKVKLKPDKCKELCEAVGLIYKPGYEERILEGLTTDETPDRYGDIVRYNAPNFSNYKKNPVVMLSHEHGQFPIGKSIKIWTDKNDKGTKSWDLYADNETDPSGRAELSFKFRKNGFMPGISIGFIPLKAKSDHSQKEREQIGLGKWGIEFLSIDYLEHSQVGIPANPSTLTDSIKAVDRKELKSIFTKEDFSTIISTGFLPSAELLEIFEHYVIKEEKAVFDFNKDLESFFENKIEPIFDGLSKSVTELTEKVDLLSEHTDGQDSHEQGIDELYSSKNISMVADLTEKKG